MYSLGTAKLQIHAAKAMTVPARRSEIRDSCIDVGHPHAIHSLNFTGQNVIDVSLEVAPEFIERPHAHLLHPLARTSPTRARDDDVANCVADA
jgi:hypothetical protein